MSYGPPQGQYGAPPPQGYHQPYPPPQGGFGGPPQQGYQAPPGPPPSHQGYQPPPGPPPSHQGFQPPPGPPPSHQQGWGQPPPPQQHYGASPPTPASPGYDPNFRIQGDASRDAQTLRTAMKGFGTNEALLIQVLTKLDPLQAQLVRETFNRQFHRDLEKDVKSETSRYFGETMLALVRGPLAQDVLNVNKGIKGLGTKESILNDVLVGRSNADMRAIKQMYQQVYHTMMERDVSGDLSLKTKDLFQMIMAATRNEESAPFIPQDIDRDVTSMYNATIARPGTDQIAVCQILTQRSDGQIRAIAHQFQQKYRQSLEDVVVKEFSGHMKDALLLAVRRACDRAMADAVQLEEAMAGMGTKDDLLVNRVVRIHWNRLHMDQVKKAYKHKYNKDLIARVQGETSGDYRTALVACLQT